MQGERLFTTPLGLPSLPLASFQPPSTMLINQTASPYQSRSLVLVIMILSLGILEIISPYSCPEHVPYVKGQDDSRDESLRRSSEDVERDLFAVRVLRARCRRGEGGRPVADDDELVGR